MSDAGRSVEPIRGEVVAPRRHDVERQWAPDVRVINRGHARPVSRRSQSLEFRAQPSPVAVFWAFMVLGPIFAGVATIALIVPELAPIIIVGAPLVSAVMAAVFVQRRLSPRN